jgi:hypothetical protein
MIHHATPTVRVDVSLGASRACRDCPSPDRLWGEYARCGSSSWALSHVASQRGHLEAVKLLLRRGTDVDVLNNANNLSRAMKIPCSLTVILLFPLLVNAYSWKFTSVPRQCQNVSLSIQGSGGQPPYSLVIIPFGPSPFPNSTEVRSIQNIHFSGTSTTLSFKLNYPADSSFVAVVRSYLSRYIFSVISSYRLRSATRAVLVPVAPALRSPFSDRPTRVVTIPLSPFKTFGITTSGLLVDPLNVNHYGCGGKRLTSAGTSLHHLS